AWLFVSINIDPPLLQVNNVNALEQYRGPLLLVVGNNDKITPPRFSRELYEKSATPVNLKTLYVAKDRYHGNALEDPGAQKLYVKFMDSIAATAG
ncbi:MAG: hypothetical protein ACRESC_06280, partial [Gammaproteobacteria bacterium]